MFENDNASQVCYMNSLVQAVRWLPKFAQEIEIHNEDAIVLDRSDDVNERKKSVEGRRARNTIVAAFRRTGIFNLRPIIRENPTIFTGMEFGKQQDASEFLEKFMRIICVEKWKKPFHFTTQVCIYCYGCKSVMFSFC